MSARRNDLYSDFSHFSTQAKHLLNPWQALFFAVLTAVFAGAICYSPSKTVIAINILVTVFFLMTIAFRLWLFWISLSIPFRDEPSSTGKLSSFEALPVVSILLPLRDEAECLVPLVHAMDALDYPDEKKDIKLILEADDISTCLEAERLGLDRRWDMVVLAQSEPRTKPKACDMALERVRGSITVIYDAEDQPETDQLQKAVAAFHCAPDDIAAFQARLNYFNAEENLITRLFALEYALWFDSFLPALAHLRLPIPLGGTSTFIRTDLLRSLGAWDPFNVTEDADLGMRIAANGFRTGVLPSTTYEEANCRLGNWLRQRSRWIKGFIQTGLVHLRRPDQFVRHAGISGLISAGLFVGGNVISALINPFLWLIFGLWHLTGSEMIASVFPGPLLTLNLFALLFGNLVFIYLAMVAPLKRGWVHLAPWGVFMPLYWLWTSLAAFRAVGQLIRKPHFWEKTDHIISAAAWARRAELLQQLEFNQRPVRPSAIGGQGLKIPPSRELVP